LSPSVGIAAARTDAGTAQSAKVLAVLDAVFDVELEQRERLAPAVAQLMKPAIPSGVSG